MHRDAASEFLRKIRKATQAGQKQHDKSSAESRAVSATDAEFLKTNKAICEKLFKDKEWVEKKDILDL